MDVYVFKMILLATLNNFLEFRLRKYNGLVVQSPYEWSKKLEKYVVNKEGSNWVILLIYVN